MSLEPLSADPTNYDGSNKARLDIKRVDEFSIGENGTLLADKRGSARYLLKEYDHSRKLENPLDLTEGYSTWVENPRTEKLEQIKQWIIGEAKNGQNLQHIVSAGIVTSRGAMTSIAISPYIFDGDDIQLVCQKYQGVIFVHRLETEIKKENDLAKNANFDIKLAEYSGRKFQQSISSRKPHGTYDASKPVNDNVKFCAIFSANLRGIKVLYSAQICCLASDGTDYLISKTQIFRLGCGRYFPRKILALWMSSYICAIDKIVFGFRDHSRIVNEMQFLNIDYIREYCPNFDVNVCFAFLETFLETVKDKMQDLTEDEVLVVERKPQSYEFNFNVLDGDNPSLKEHIVIDEDFKKHFEQ
ncbi:RAI1 like PD-(D/E)XK nuclease domain-containing protein [Ditylenchus destructor]|nr:RAI1 like PD-(D/E)XK nuclease domain-containing protein [Ditylenchus destructor]